MSRRRRSLGGNTVAHAREASQALAEAERHVEAAGDEWKRGASASCLTVGKAIDRAYLALGKFDAHRGHLTDAVHWSDLDHHHGGVNRDLRAMDGKFERACVRKHPGKD